MSDQNSSNSSNDDVAHVLVIAAIGLLVIGFILPLLLLSFPFAMMLGVAIDDDRPLISFFIALVIGFVSYLFLYGANPSFAGLILGSFNDELYAAFEWLTNLKYVGAIVLRNVEFEDLRVYFWLSYPMGVLVALGLKIKETKDFKHVTKILKVVALPYFYVEGLAIKGARKWLSERVTAVLFVVTSMILFYCIVYLTFGSVVSWHIQFGYFLNKGLFVFKILSPWFVNIVKQYFYFTGALYPIVRIATFKVADLYSFENQTLVLEKNSCAHWGGVYLGKDHKDKPIIIDQDTLNHHVHVVGASGFGKTTFLLNIIKEKIEAHEGVIFVDLKGDIDTICEIASFAKNAGRIDEFEFFSISENFLEVSKGISLFANGNALEIKDKLMGAFNYDHEYYKKRIESFLNLSLRALVYLRDKKERSFDLESIYKLTQGFEYIEELSGLIDNKSIKDDLLTLASDKKLKEDLTGLRADIEGLIKTDFGHLLSENNGINFYDSIRQSKIVYVHLDSQRYEVSAEKLGRIVLQDIKTASAKIVSTISKSDRRPLTLIVDEFANLATEQFVGFLNKARSSGIGIVIAHQELSDLDVFSPTVRDQVMTNTSTLFSFLQKLPKSAETIAGIAGTYKTEKETEQTGEEGLFFKTKEKTGMGSIREVEEYLIHPNMIKELMRGECFMVSKYPYSRIAYVRREAGS
jgi:hypothetical protein